MRIRISTYGYDLILIVTDSDGNLVGEGSSVEVKASNIYKVNMHNPVTNYRYVSYIYAVITKDNKLVQYHPSGSIRNPAMHNLFKFTLED